MELRTHILASKHLVGEVVEQKEGFAKAVLKTTEEMRVDEKGLVHGSFTFGVADLAAMAAVNEPNVVLARVEAIFLKPVKVGDTIIAEAQIAKQSGSKYIVEVVAHNGFSEVLKATMECFVLEKHVLDK